MAGELIGSYEKFTPQISDGLLHRQRGFNGRLVPASCPGCGNIASSRNHIPSP